MPALSDRKVLAVSGACLVLALGGLANGYRVEQAALDDRDSAIANGVVRSVAIDGSLRNRQQRTSVRFVLDGVERRVAVFPDRAYTRGLVVDVAGLPTNPESLYIVGATPWTWWAAMRLEFALAAFAAAALALTFLFLGRWRAR